MFTERTTVAIDSSPMPNTEELQAEAAVRTPRKALRHGVLGLTATLLALVALFVTAGAAGATEGPVLLRPGTRCWPANTSGGVALIGVDPPQLRPMPSSVPVYVGADNQSVRYQAYLQRWSGSSWVTMTGGTSPLFTGTTNYYTTTFAGPTGGWTGWNITQRSTPQYYRVVASVWWVADSSHASAYSSGVTDIQQYGAAYGWNPVSYCTY
jgi:hypothetical protein